MSNLNFDHLDITTVTAMVNLTGVIKIIPAFFLTEIHRVEVPPEVTSKKKFKLPPMKEPGKVLSLTTCFSNDKQFTRGINKSKTFKNTITMDVSVTGKNVNLKIYESQIHMCGVKSRKMAEEAGNIVIDKLNKTQLLLEYIKDRPDEMIDTIQWVKENTRGSVEYVEEGTIELVKEDQIKAFTPEMMEYLKEEAQREMEEQVQLFRIQQIQQELDANSLQARSLHEGPILNIIEDLPMLENTTSEALNTQEAEINPNLVGYIPYDNERGWIGVEKVNYIVLPDELVQQKHHFSYSSRPINCYPEGVNGIIANFLLDQAFDFERHDLYCAHLDCIATIENVIEGEIEISNVLTSMVNYNYDLGFHVKRGELSDRIYGICGFVPIYENTYDHSVKIQLPYEIPVSLKDKVKIRGNPKHTFMIYKGGKITQSGSCEELARGAYVMFNRVIKSIRPYIEEPGDNIVDLKILSLDQILKRNARNGIDWISDGTMKIMS
jgi:hypothetical protein